MLKEILNKMEFVTTGRNDLELNDLGPIKQELKLLMYSLTSMM